MILPLAALLTLMIMVNGCVIAEPQLSGRPIAAVLRGGDQLVIAPGVCTPLTQIHVKVEYGNAQVYEDSHVTVLDTTLPDSAGTIQTPPLDVKLASALWVRISVRAIATSQTVEFWLESTPSELRHGVDRKGVIAIPVESYAQTHCRS